MYMEAYSAVTYLGVHVLVDLSPVEHGSIVLVDVDNSQTPRKNWDPKIAQDVPDFYVISTQFNFNIQVNPRFNHSGYLPLLHPRNRKDIYLSTPSFLSLLDHSVIMH